MRKIRVNLNIEDGNLMGPLSDVTDALSFLHSALAANPDYPDGETEPYGLAHILGLLESEMDCITAYVGDQEEKTRNGASLPKSREVAHA